MKTKTVPDIAGKDYSAILTPHRSLSPFGFLIVMTVVCVISFTAGIIFLLNGAWPVFGFFGLDVALIYLAFKLNYRSGRLYEMVTLANDELNVTRVYPSGKSEKWSFNPYWVHLELIPTGRTSALSLWTHDKKLIFGAFLTEEEKEDFAKELNGALFEYRGGTRI